MNYAVIDENTNIVVNVALWDGKSLWSPPKGTFAIQSDASGIGWFYNPSDGSFTPAKEE
jgi:hypothetical protein